MFLKYEKLNSMVKICRKQAHMHTLFKIVQDLPKEHKTWNYDSIGYTNSNEMYFMSNPRFLDLISSILRSISTYSNSKFKSYENRACKSYIFALTWKLISQGYTNPNETYHLCFPRFLGPRNSNWNPKFTNSIQSIQSTIVTELQDLC